MRKRIVAAIALKAQIMCKNMSRAIFFTQTSLDSRVFVKKLHIAISAFARKMRQFGHENLLIMQLCFKPCGTMYKKKPFKSKKKNPILRGMDRAMHEIKSARGPMETPWQHAVAHFESLFVDDGFLSILFPNRHRISEKMWRSSQPYYLQVSGLAKKGIKTIINLRGKRDCASYMLEEIACKKHGIKIVNFPVNSRQPPKLEILEQLEKLFSEIEYPALMHCKAGSDRAGIMSALYLMLAEKKSVKIAMKQLSLRFGHVRQSKTGVLDKFLETFEIFSTKNKIDFMTWARKHYNRDEVIASHKTFSWAEWLYDRALKRE